jgi:hypothetical protein
MEIGKMKDEMKFKIFLRKIYWPWMGVWNYFCLTFIIKLVGPKLCHFIVGVITIYKVLRKHLQYPIFINLYLFEDNNIWSSKEIGVFSFFLNFFSI